MTHLFTQKGENEYYSLDYIESLSTSHSQAVKIVHDDFLNHWRLTFQLEPQRYWFLSVFVNDNGKVAKYSLDYEAASDSHYEFSDAASIRKLLYKENDDILLLHEMFIRFVEEKDGFALLKLEALANHPISYDDQIVRQILESVIVESKDRIKVVLIGGLEVTQLL